MPGDPPLVSVSLMTYNQDAFLADSIRSVLNQTITDLELIVVDDGSADRTPQVVAEFSDPRIVYVRQSNQGPGGAANTALAVCRGRYVALMTGDDLSYPTRLADQLVAHARAGGGVLFSNVDYIDERGHPLVDGHYPKDFFLIPPLSRAEILYRFFQTGNFIHPVTMFAERRVFREVGPYEPLLYQLQDFELLLRLIKRHPFVFMPERTVSWRIRAAGGNLSAFSPFKQVRGENEYYLILRRFFDDTPPDLLREAFGKDFVRPDSRTPEELACETAFLCLRHGIRPLARLVGVERLYDLLRDPQTADLLARKYSFGTTAYVEQLGLIDVMGLTAAHRSYLLGDAGNGFDGGPCAEVVFNPEQEEFSLTFNLAGFPPCRALRWDAMRMRSCSIQLREVVWEDRKGGTGAIDVNLVRPWTGRSTGSGEFVFETLFPALGVPIEGELRSVTFHGRWTPEHPGVSAGRVSNKILEYQQVIAEQGHQLEVARAELEQTRQLLRQK